MWFLEEFLRLFSVAFLAELNEWAKLFLLFEFFTGKLFFSLLLLFCGFLFFAPNHFDLAEINLCRYSHIECKSWIIIWNWFLRAYSTLHLMVSKWTSYLALKAKVIELLRQFWWSFIFLFESLLVIVNFNFHRKFVFILHK